MASPSSTTAYLMSVPTWDIESENYFVHVVTRGLGKGRGSVPSAFPSTNFEYSWILSTLLSAGLTNADLGFQEMEHMARTLRRSMVNGAVGFAPSIEPEADDTAKAVFALGKLCKVDVPWDSILKVFEGPRHFRTYKSERHPSFSANCNILIALLHTRDLTQVTPQIAKVTGFLCDVWWNSTGNIKDKLNLSSLYPTMLITQAFTKLLALVDNGALAAELFADETLARVRIALFQGCFRTLLRQKAMGLGRIQWSAPHTPY